MAITDYYVSSTGTGFFVNSQNSGIPSSWVNACLALSSGQFTATGVSGVRVNIKADGGYVFSVVANDTLYVTGSPNTPVIFRGYKNTPGDGYQGRINGNGPLITGNMPLFTGSTVNIGFNASSSPWVIFDSLNFQNNFYNNSSPSFFNLAINNILKSSYISISTLNSTPAIQAQGTNALIFDCDIYCKSTTGAAVAITLGGASCIVDSNHIFNNSSTGIGILVNAASATIYGNIISGGGHSISQTTASFTNVIYARNNTMINSHQNSIQCISGGTNMHMFLGNCITDCATGYGISISGNVAAIFAYNRFRNNSGSNNLNIFGASVSGVTGDWSTGVNYAMVTGGGTTYDYYNISGGDYRLINSSPAVGAGWPPFSSIGALQKQAAIQSMSSFTTD